MALSEPSPSTAEHTAQGGAAQAVRAPRRSAATAPALRAWRELALVLALTLLSATLSAHFELSERAASWLHRRESLQVDELPGVLLVLTCGLLWFGWRRYADVARARDDHWQAERRLAEQLDRNRQLHLELLAVQERERRAIARELHDELGQYLGALRLDLHALAEAAPGLSAGEGTTVLARAGDNLNHIHVTLREMIRRLRPVGLDELGLPAALDQLIAGWRQRMPDTRFELLCQDTELALDETTAIAVFRIVQEALTNVARHSRAGLVSVSLARASARLCLSVSDDGIGMDPGQPVRGLGLVSIAERVSALGGEHRWESQPGQGFTLWARLPLPEARDA